MKKWGAIITVFYAVIIMVLLVPLVPILFAGYDSGVGFFEQLSRGYAAWGVWIPIAILVFSQALLLFLRVDTSFKKLKPRAHIVVSTAITSFFMAVLTFGGVFSLRAGFKGDNFGFLDGMSSGAALGWLLAGCAVLWLLWGIIFYRFSRNSTDPITRAVSWMLRGSVLELLIAVPAHVVARRRHDSSAPYVTSFGIASGIAIMLLSFGPSVLLLYKKRMDAYSARAAAGK